jgi:nitrogenase molybdenum-iron protein alpha/beta subunit
VAFLLAHTTGPSTRISGHPGRSPDVTLYGKDVRTNPFVAEGRQGASGMTAALAGRPRQAIKILTLGDASCRQTFPALSPLPFFDTWSYFPVSTAPAPEDWVAIDYSEKDIVGGAEDRLRQVLRGLKRRQPAVKVALIQTCVSRLVGDDVRGILEDELKDGNYLILDPDFMTRDAAVDSLVWPWLLKTFRPARPRKRQRLINLAGLGERGFPALDELENSLGELGVDLNACLFPSFSEEELPGFYSAQLTVASTCSIVQNAFSLAARADAKHRWIFVDPPFGLEQTRTWTRGVLSEVLGGQRLKNARAALDRRYRSYRKKQRPLEEALSGHSIALVASARYASFLFDPSQSFGIPLVRMLAGLGLKVELFIFKDISPPRDLGKSVQGQERATLRTFDDPQELQEAVRASGSRLLLTSIRRNSPALALGKLPVTVHAFEMGFDGALRTAERLGHLCRTGFVDRYRRYFRP